MFLKTFHCESSLGVVCAGLQITLLLAKQTSKHSSRGEALTNMPVLMTPEFTRLSLKGTQEELKSFGPSLVQVLSRVRPKS